VGDDRRIIIWFSSPRLKIRANRVLFSCSGEEEEEEEEKKMATNLVSSLVFLLIGVRT